MPSSSPLSSTASRSLLNPVILNWSKEHYRDRTFSKDESIPTRPGLLYIVQQGAVRLIGQSKIDPPPSSSVSPETSHNFVGLIGAEQPFEIIAQPAVTLQAYAHLENTVVVWMYWHDLDNWPTFHQKILESFRYQHQRHLLWLSILGQRRTLDRLWGFLTLLIEEYGELTENGYCLPYPLTHAQIGSAIGSTRVTVTRLMGRLRQQGLIIVPDTGEHLICLPNGTF